MTTTLRFTDDDRDDQGFVKVPSPPRNPEPRSLADLLPATDVQRPTTIRPLTRQDVISAAVVVPLLLAALLYISSSSTPTAPVTPPRAPTAPAATSAPVPTAPPIVAMLPAFAAPDGAQLGAIEATRAITPTAHYGSAWIQADVAGSGRIWLRASDWPQLAIVGPDLAPRPTRAPAVVIATATPEPQPPCLTAGTGAQMVTVCDWLESDELRVAAAAKWVATYGGSIGKVATPSPQVVR